MGIEQKENARILVVDDADSIRLQICAYLRQHGYNVNDAWSLAGAMRAINLLELDLAIVDLELGDGDGLTLVRALQEKGVPCMVVSVRSAVIDRVLSLELGADDYMVKPIDLREMLLRVKKIVAITFRRTSRRRPSSTSARSVSIWSTGRSSPRIASRSRCR